MSASPLVPSSESLKATAPPKPVRDPGADLPRRFGRLTLLRPIARGGMGEVFLATTGGIEGAERPCVVKIIRREHAEDASFLARFFDEARVQAQLDHPGVARVLEAETDPSGKPYVVVEYVEGRNLAELRNRGSQLNAGINWADAVAIAVSLAEALCYVHERTDHLGNALSIVHRDLSPQNVMIGYGGDVKLIDFGTARGENRKCHTVSGVVLAKPGYVAPEVANQTPGGVPADVYALGIILWELSAGRRFLTGDPQGHVRAVATGKKNPSPIAALVRAPAELDTIIARMTAPRIEDRYASARDAMSDLVRLLKRAPSLANGERSVRGRIAHLMDRMYPAEPMRSRAELAGLVAAARADVAAKPAIAVAPTLAPTNDQDDEGLLPGTRYRILGELGRGAMGVVYEGLHVDIGRRVALKVLPKERCGSVEMEERFRKEARAIARLRHEGLVLLHDFGIASDGRPFYAMELCEGETLERRLLRGPIPWRETLQIGVDTCRALRAAHASGLVHRDIKPGNVFITRDGGIKLLDFGVVQTGEEVASSDQESALRLTGTVEYMAPEQAAGRAVDERADLFALAAMLYECLTGALPHEAEGLIQLVDKKLSEPATPPSVRAPTLGIPRAVDRVVVRSLQLDPGLRYANASEMRDALSHAIAAPERARARRRGIGAAAVALGLGVLATVALLESADPTIRARASASIAPAAERMGVGVAAVPTDEDHPVAVLYDVAPAADAPAAVPASDDTTAESTGESEPAENAADAPSPDADDPSAAPAVPEEVRDALARIESYASAGQGIKALSAARRLVARHPSSPEALAAWSEAAIHTKGWGEALRAAVKWASVDPSVSAQLHLARVQKAVGQRLGAVATLERLLDLHPGQPDARALLGQYSPNRLALR